LTEITRDIFVCLVGVWQRNFEPAVCVCMVRRTMHTKISRVISVKHVQHSLMMDRKRSETFRSDF